MGGNNCEEDSCINVFSSKGAAVESLSKYCEKYNLCQKLCGLYSSAGACFYHALDECKGACCGKESTTDYNKRANAFTNEISLNLSNVFIVLLDNDDGRTGIISIGESKYQGYGFVDDLTDISVHDLHDVIQKFPDNKDVNQIIRTFLKFKKSYKLIKY